MDLVFTDEPEDVREAYVRARSLEGRQILDALVPDLLARHGLTLRFDEVIYHDEFQAKHGNVEHRSAAYHARTLAATQAP